jgi:site-specific DNA recombinase
VDDVLDGKPMKRIARELTADGYRPPAAYYVTLRAGRPALRWSPGEVPSAKWGATPMRNMLRSRAIRGYAHHNGQTVRDDDGNPIQIAEPLVTGDEWELLQAALDRIQESRSGALRSEASPLSGVVVCYICGAPLHHDRNAFTRNGHNYEYKYYRCRERDDDRHQGSAMIPADMLEELAEESFLRELGDTEVRERVWVRGDTQETELREAVTALDELIAAAGRLTSNTAKQRLQRQISALDARIAELEQLPTREARWEWKATGGTYGDAWRAAGTDPDARRELLQKSGITIAACIRGVDGKRSATNGGDWRIEVRVPDAAEL